MSRIYLASSLEALAAAHAAGAFPAGGERFVAPDEDEESEYAALAEAAAASASAGARRRVVVVAELDGDPDAAFGMDRVVAVHADTTEGQDPDDDLAWFATQEVPRLLEG